MKNLIKLEQCDDGMRVSSQLIASGIGVEHRASMTLIKKHQSRMETFGDLTFKMSGKSKNKQDKHFLLNEDQAIFLITLSRNTEKVVDFKQALVTRFSRLRRKQALIDERHANAEWHQNRELGKYQRRDITDSIKQFVSYAQAQGSRGANHYYINITKCIQKALGISGRGEVGEDALHLLATAEVIAERVLLHGMADQSPYKTIFQGLKQQMETFAKMVAMGGSDD